MADGISAAATSLRERKKAATRLALHRAVAELAAAKDLDAVTVDAITDLANVSRRTFSNYFASKEEALLYGERMRFERLVAQVHARPERETAWQALSNNAHVLTEGIEEMDPVRLAQLRLARRHPSVAAHLMAMQSTVERDLAAELANRAGDRTDAEPLRSRVLAAVFLATVRAAIGVWIEAPERGSLAELVDAALDAAAQRLR